MTRHAGKSNALYCCVGGRRRGGGLVLSVEVGQRSGRDVFTQTGRTPTGVPNAPILIDWSCGRQASTVSGIWSRTCRVLPISWSNSDS